MVIFLRPENILVCSRRREAVLVLKCYMVLAVIQLYLIRLGCSKLNALTTIKYG